MNASRDDRARCLAACTRAVWAVALWLISTPPLAAQAPETTIVMDAQLPTPLQHCVSTEQLQASYRRALAADAPAEPRSQQLQPTELRVLLRTPELPDGEVVQLELRAFDRERALGARILPVRARDCAALPDTLALVLLLLSQDGEAAELSPPTAALPAPAPPDLSEPQLRSQPVAAEEPSVGVGLGVGLQVGMLARAAFDLHAELEVLASQALSLRARATLLWPQTLAIAEGVVEMRSYELSLEVCPTWRPGGQSHVTLRVCVGPRAALMRATARNFVLQNDQVTELVLSFGALPDVRLALGEATWLQLGVGAAVVLQRPRFVLQFQTAGQRSELSGPQVVRAELGLGLVQIF